MRIHPFVALFLFSTAVLSNIALAEDSLLQREPSGWENLLQDESLSNWVRVQAAPNEKYPLAAKSPWSFDPKTGILMCQAEGAYELFFEKMPRKDGVLHVEWRYVGNPEKPDSGILVRGSMVADTWLQAQLALPGLGTMSNKVRPQDQDKKVKAAGTRHPDWIKPDGQWNVMEITCDGPKIALWFNGETVSQVDNYGIDDPYIGLQAEYKPIEFQNIKFRPISH